MSEFSEGMAVGQSLGNGNNNCCYPMVPMMPMYGGYGYGTGGFGGMGGWGGDGWWILLLLLCGWGNNGNWNNGGNGQMLGYELGKVATTNDVASGFNNSAVLGGLNDLKLGQTQGFAGVQQTLCQGFSGVNATVNQVGNTINQGICNLGYEVQGAFNGVSRQIADCCCDLKTMNLENRYISEKQACDLRNAIYNSTRDIIDSNRCGFDRIENRLIQQEMDQLRSENQTLKFEKSQANQNAFIAANRDAQTAELLRRLGRDCPTAAFLVPNPNCCYDQNIFNFNRNGCNSCCG